MHMLEKLPRLISVKNRYFDKTLCLALKINFKMLLFHLLTEALFHTKRGFLCHFTMMGRHRFKLIYDKILSKNIPILYVNR